MDDANPCDALRDGGELPDEAIKQTSGPDVAEQSGRVHLLSAAHLGNESMLQ